MGFTYLDYTVIIVYLLGVAILGLRTSGKQTSNKDYFLGGDGIPWWAVLFSIVATETSTLTFISIPAVAYGGNLTFLQITIGYLAGRILVAAKGQVLHFSGKTRKFRYEFINNVANPNINLILSCIRLKGVNLFG